MVDVRTYGLSALMAMGCGELEEVAPIGETGGETGELGTLPNGDDCGPNWYAIDGEMIVDDFDEPEAFGGELLESDVRVEFTRPAPPARVYPSSEIDPGFTEMSHDEFVAQYAEPRGHDWIVEGDQPLTNASLLALSEQLRGDAGAPSGPTLVAANYAEGGFDATWSSSRKLSLTWCIGRIMPSPNVDAETHQLNFTRTIETMEWATRAWERAGDINFVHLVEFDSPASQGSGDCQPGENGIHFRVRTGPECIHGCAGGTEPEAIPMFEWLDPADVEGTAEIIVGLHRFMNNDTQPASPHCTNSDTPWDSHTSICAGRKTR